MIKKTKTFPLIERIFPFIARRRYKSFVKEVTSCKSLVSINAQDCGSLFGDSKCIFSCEYSLPADTPDRMRLLVNEAKRDIQKTSKGKCKSLLFYIASPKSNTLMMDEMNEVHDWLADSKDTLIQWGYGEFDDDRIRLIVIWK